MKSRKKSPTAFAVELRAWRGARYQKEAADLFNVPLDTYRDWEQGRHQPSPSLLGFLRDRMKETGEAKAE